MLERLPVAREASSRSSPAAPARRVTGLEVALVVIVSLAVLVPGIWNYSLVDPWETHYGEVARMMLQNRDFVHMEWPGGMTPNDNEGFRSKPVLTFWLMAAGMRALGVAEHGGYSGEMVASVRTLIGIRLPFVVFATLGLVAMWFMLAKLVDRKLAWLALLVVGTCPFFCLVARQGIPDMLLVACVMGAMSLFALATEDGERPISRALAVRIPATRHWIENPGSAGGRSSPGKGVRRWIEIDHRQVVLGVCGTMVGIQAIYYAVYFAVSPQLALRGLPSPIVVFPAFMTLLFAGLWPSGWRLVRFGPIVVGAILAISIAAVRRRSLAAALENWDRYAPDRFLIRVVTFPIAWASGGGWGQTDRIADRALEMRPVTTMRQVYLLWCYAFLGLSVLAKGPPGLTVVGLVGAFHVLAFWRWGDLYHGMFEIKRGVLLMTVIFLPWHLAMWLKDGMRFIDEYLLTHVINRAAVGVDNSPGTFEHYALQIGHGMWLWAALLPAALGAALLRSRNDTCAGRVRFLMALWAICAVGLFSMVQTKFHHYILPAVPALGILVAFLLYDIAAQRDRLHPLYAALGIGIVLLICRDLMWEPERWIEMFVFRYDRPWPSGEPWSIDPSDGFLGLGIAASLALAVAALPWRRLGVAALCAAGLAICLWSLHAYMPVAGTHWGMRDAMRHYYKNRTIYGVKRVYFGADQAADALSAVGDVWHFETFIPDNLVIDQPMMITVQINKPTDERTIDQQLALVGHVTAIGDHDIAVTLEPGEHARIAQFVAEAKRKPRPSPNDAASRHRKPIEYVDADRLIAWQLYWRGENFWSGEEIFGWAAEMRTGFGKTDNVDFLKYLNDRTKAPLGRRYFVVTEAGRAMGLRSLLPTQRARDSFKVIDTTSNKFTMVAFYL